LVSTQAFASAGRVNQKNRVRIPEITCPSRPNGTGFAARLRSSKSRDQEIFKMTEPTDAERTQTAASDLAAAARDRGMAHLEDAKGHIAEGAERVAAAVERTADELEGEGDDTVSGFGHSLAGLMRQLAGGLRERDVDQFASELGALARRNPGVFLAGSVALGFGVARFFKARAPQARSRHEDDWRDAGERPLDSRDDFDPDESLDLSRNPSAVEPRSEVKAQRPSTGTAESTTDADESALTGAMPGGKEP
jgi:hypothetical protein